MKLRLDTLNLWLRECARLCDAGERLTLAASETKLHAAEAFLQSSLDMVPILGASGREADGGMADLVQDALAGRLFSGSSEAQKNIIAVLLGRVKAIGENGPEARFAERDFRVSDYRLADFEQSAKIAHPQSCPVSAERPRFPTVRDKCLWLHGP